jgi:hypothetical protein
MDPDLAQTSPLDGRIEVTLAEVVVHDHSPTGSTEDVAGGRGVEADVPSSIATTKAGSRCETESSTLRLADEDCHRILDLGMSWTTWNVIGLNPNKQNSSIHNWTPLGRVDALIR